MLVAGLVPPAQELKRTSIFSGALGQPEGVGWGGRRGREVQEGGDIRTPLADSCRWMAETNIIVQSNCPPIKNNIFLKLKKMSHLVSLGSEEYIKQCI